MKDIHWLWTLAATLLVIFGFLLIYVWNDPAVAIFDFVAAGICLAVGFCTRHDRMRW